MLTKDVDKGTDELVGIKKAVVEIQREGLYKFEVRYKGSTR